MLCEMINTNLKNVKSHVIKYIHDMQPSQNSKITQLNWQVEMNQLSEIKTKFINIKRQNKIKKEEEVYEKLSLFGMSANIDDKKIAKQRKIMKKVPI